LLSLDIDGVDLWLWKSIDKISPRVVIVEYMNIWGANDSITVPYKENFNRFDYHEDFFGTSLSAFVKLAHQKGYKLLGVNRLSFNAIFIRDDIFPSFIKEASVVDCLDNFYAKKANKERLGAVKDMGWEVF